MWDGGSTGTGTSWGTANNWVGDSALASGANLLIQTRTGGGTLPNLSVGGSFTLGTITFSDASGALPASLTVSANGSGGSTTRTITLNGGITIADSSKAVQFNASTNGTLGITLGASPVSFNLSSTSTLTLNPVISGVGGFVKSGSGTLVLNGNNTFTGPSTISKAWSV